MSMVPDLVSLLAMAALPAHNTFNTAISLATFSMCLYKYIGTLIDILK